MGVAANKYAPKRTEHGEAKAFFSYCKLRAATDWRYGMVIAIPNQGKRTFATARYMQSEGMPKGFPDYLVLVPVGAWHGAAIELKTAVGRVSPEQSAWLERLTAAGYISGIQRGADDAIAFIDGYFAGAFG